MSEQYLSEIRLFSFGFAPKGWMACNGQVLAINANQALFSLLGTAFGGNGVTTFALPNLQGRVGIATGNGYTFGQASGEVTHTLTNNEMAVHSHSLMGRASLADASVAGTQPSPSMVLAEGFATDKGTQISVPMYDGRNNPGSGPLMAQNAIGQNAGGQAHENRQPYLTMNYCIATTGIFPTPG
jgi:microcystin-dependent protein